MGCDLTIFGPADLGGAPRQDLPRALSKSIGNTSILYHRRGLPRPALLGVSDSRRSRRLGEIRERIAGDIFAADFEVQVRAGGAAAGADSGDGLPAHHAGAFL